MKKIVIDQRGITLVEILAAIVIIGFLSILILNIQVKSSDQYNEQLSKNQQLNEISYVLKVITKDIRKSTNISYIDSTEEQITENGKNITIYTGINIDSNEYKLNKISNTITLNDSTFANNIKNFYVINNEDEWKLYIENTEGKKISTTIYVRSGS